MKEEVRDRNRKIREEVSNEPREIYCALIQGRNAIERDKKRAKEKSKKIQGRRNKQDEGRIGWDKEKDIYKNKQKERMKRKKNVHDGYAYGQSRIYSNSQKYLSTYKEINSKIFIFIKMRLRAAIAICNGYKYVDKYFFENFFEE